MTPTKMIAAIKSDVPTGRSMKIRDGFMSRMELLVGLGGAAGAAAARCGPLRSHPLALLAVGTRRSVAGRNLAVGRCGGDRRTGRAGPLIDAADLGAIAQAVGAVDDDLVADLEPL